MLFITVLIGFAFAEFAGYFIHKLLHSDKIHFLSRSHMIHHLVIYGPKMKQRPHEHYLNSAQGRFAIGNVGLEWTLPIGVMVAILFGLFALFHVPVLYAAVFIGSAAVWSISMFSYVHDLLHVKNCWLTKIKFFNNQFDYAKKLHDIHHMELTDEGHMAKNFGICFFIFDRFFGTLKPTTSSFNKKGFEAASKRYAFIHQK